MGRSYFAVCLFSVSSFGYYSLLLVIPFCLLVLVACSVSDCSCCCFYHDFLVLVLVASVFIGCLFVSLFVPLSVCLVLSGFLGCFSCSISCSMASCVEQRRSRR